VIIRNDILFLSQRLNYNGDKHNSKSVKISSARSFFSGLVGMHEDRSDSEKSVKNVEFNQTQPGKVTIPVNLPLYN
jgi:hypothetical protein